MKTSRNNYPYDTIIDRIKRKQWNLEIVEVDERDKNYIFERLIKGQDIFHIIIENNVVLNGSNVLTCLVELDEINNMDDIILMRFYNQCLSIIEILK